MPEPVTEDVSQKQGQALCVYAFVKYFDVPHFNWRLHAEPLFFLIKRSIISGRNYGGMRNKSWHR